MLEKVADSIKNYLSALELDEDDIQAIKHLQLLTLNQFYMWLTLVKMT